MLERKTFEVEMFETACSTGFVPEVAQTTGGKLKELGADKCIYG